MLHKIKSLGLFLIFINLINCTSSKSGNDINIKPISHATMVLEYKNTIIYVDPVGGKLAFNNQKKPTLILITDIHGDHLNLETLEELNGSSIQKIVPKAVAEKFNDDLGQNTIVINNSETYTVNENITIEAIPMYNLREDALKFHPKGRGNGYVLTLGEKRIYISGDTEDITEMRNLKNIDIAFVCMNLPYTMTVESAADAVKEFKPKKVYPYHYRGKNGLSDVDKFKTLVKNDVEVIQLNWYK